MTIYLGENIKRLRLEKGITQETLADFFGVTFQSVSRWERGESYPDITLLPEIAAYFKISIDELLGVKREEDEEEIRRLLEEHDNLTDESLIWEAINNLKEKYPNDFRVQLRYMGNLVFYNKIDDNRSKIPALYENIQQNCTDDSVRICAKRYYIYYLQMLSAKEDSEVTFEDYEKIIKEMPRMRDGQEIYCFSYKIHNHPDCYEIIQEAIEEEISILYDTLSDYYFCSEKFSREYQIDILERTKEFFNYVYNDGNYSRMWRVVINCCYGILGWFYFQKGDNEKALHNLRKSAELAVKFDNLERITTLHSTLFEGKRFDKHILGSTFVAASWVKELFTEQYPLSDEFKSTPEFRNIIAMLE
ncbi:MAG: helix-turn-helix transcriptional regulator [Clostridia bacterium]|nr:helix-turn-helix transcriptional regulator [Clostridia bacterium]